MSETANIERNVILGPDPRISERGHGGRAAEIPGQARDDTLLQSYARTRARVETYFDRTATRTWERLTSDAPVSGIRATVRAGRDRMRDLILGELPADLRGARVLDAGCGTGALAFDLAGRGALVTGVDISPQLIEIARKRQPARLMRRLDLRAGDMLDVRLGQFDYVVAMDSLIYYSAEDIARMLGALAPRLGEKMIFTVAPRTPLLMLMWRAGKLFPRADRAPTMVPHTPARLAHVLQRGRLRDIERVTSGFYISHALEFRP